jgi:hypothetical protein
MAWTDVLWDIGKEILGDVAGAAAKTLIGGGSTGSAATQTQNALLQSTLDARKTAATYRSNLATAAAKGFVQPSPAAKPVTGGNAADILASLVTQDDVKAFYLAMSRDQQRAQQQGTRNQTA